MTHRSPAVRDRAPGSILEGRTEPLERDLTTSQLFLDDTWIDDQQMLTRRWHPASIYPEPVLRPEAPWEGTAVTMYGTVLRIGDRWRMYYRTHAPDHGGFLCVAESDDGLRWERPALGIHEYRGSTANNIVMTDMKCASVMYDPEDEAAPFKGLVFVSHGGITGAISRDGYRWQVLDGLFIKRPIVGDVHYLWSQKVDGKYIITHKTHLPGYERAERCVAISESDDFRTFSGARLILRSDLIDPADIQYHGMAGFPYAGMYLGLAERWVNVPNHIELLLVWSHDRKTWHLPPSRVPFIGPTYDWNRCWSTSASNAPIQVGNQLRFYFGGRSIANYGIEGGKGRLFAAIGLATTTVDRFASISAGFQEGRLITRPMIWPGGDLLLNASTTRHLDGHPGDGGGQMAIEVWDAAGRPVEGFSGEARAPFDGNAPIKERLDPATIRWPGGRSLHELAGQPIRLVFYLRDSHLYSFRSSG